MKEVHILNGDALKDQFPSSIKGEKIVARECLVDGPVRGDTLDEFFSCRSNYLDDEYLEIKLDYDDDVASEFKKIIALPEDSKIHLWFEDDLFCQINLWFVSSLIEEFILPKQVFLVRPNTNLQYGFGGLDTKGLTRVYTSRNELSCEDISLFASLWKLYQENNHSQILKLAKENSAKLPFLLKAAKANFDRFPSDGSLGKPKQTLLDIMEEIDSDEFGPVFQEFHKRESIYGFGDLQVKKMFDQLKNFLTSSLPFTIILTIIQLWIEQKHTMKHLISL